MLNSFLQMTWNNPIFMMVLIGSIWFVPGLVVRRIAENKIKVYKKKVQEEKISSLYPKQRNQNPPLK